MRGALNSDIFQAKKTSLSSRIKFGRTIAPSSRFGGADEVTTFRIVMADCHRNNILYIFTTAVASPANITGN